MPSIEIFTTPFCPYCYRAKKLLEEKNVVYLEHDVTRDSAQRDAMRRKSGGVGTVPQIFIDDRHLGGCDDLYELDGKGDLDRLLGRTDG